MKPFPCDQCGLCCRLIKKPHDFPYSLKEDGVTCTKLNDDDDTCSVYQNRPLICNVKEYYLHLQKELNMSWEEFCKMNTNVCSILKGERYEK